MYCNFSSVVATPKSRSGRLGMVYVESESHIMSMNGHEQQAGMGRLRAVYIPIQNPQKYPTRPIGYALGPCTLVPLSSDLFAITSGNKQMVWAKSRIHSCVYSRNMYINIGLLAMPSPHHLITLPYYSKPHNVLLVHTITRHIGSASSSCR